MHAEQMHLLAPPLEPEAEAKSPSSTRTMVGDKEISETTRPVPVIYQCHACDRRTKQHQVFRLTHQRHTRRASYWHPDMRRQVSFAEITWTTTDGRTHRGENPPAAVCPTCKGPAYGVPVRGHFSARKPCDARCIYAKGPDCECSCGGANHGAGHAPR